MENFKTSLSNLVNRLMDTFKKGISFVSNCFKVFIESIWVALYSMIWFVILLALAYDEGWKVIFSHWFVFVSTAVSGYVAFKFFQEHQTRVKNLEWDSEKALQLRKRGRSITAWETGLKWEVALDSSNLYKQFEKLDTNKDIFVEEFFMDLRQARMLMQGGSTLQHIQSYHWRLQAGYDDDLIEDLSRTLSFINSPDAKKKS
tara:strand:- start:32 stop:637 length:606 start_codon:yes stop_codon:yes gene_type:complete